MSLPAPLFYSALDEYTHIILLSIIDVLYFIYRPIAKEPTALYMNLCLHFISKWQSFDNAEKDNRLEAGVEAIIIQIFNSLKRTFGADLIEGILAFLTFAVEGVTDTEMVDLLSLDDDILKFVFQYSTPKVRKLPYHVWLRVRSSLGTLLVEGEGGSYLWYHRQLKEVSNLFLSLLPPFLHQHLFYSRYLRIN